MSDKIKFREKIPSDIADWRLVEGGLLSKDLVWKHWILDTKIRVPNVWYNQTVEMRVKAIEFCIFSAETAIDMLENDPRLDRKAKLIDWHRRRIAGMRRLIEETRRQGKPLA